MRGETVQEMVLFVRHPEVPDGFWVSVNAHPIRSPDGTCGGAIVVFRDITETQQARVALKRGEGMFRALIESVQDVISILDAQGYIRFVSPAIENTLGYTPVELIGRNALHLLHPEDLLRLRDIFRTGLQRAGGIVDDDFRVRHKNGSWRLFAGVGKNQLGHPDVAGIVINARDVTTRVRAEQQELFHASLLDHLRNAVVALDTEGRIIYWNSFASKLYQWGPEEVLGRALLEVTIPPPNRSQYEDVLRAVQTTGYWEGEFLKQRRDGTTFPALLTIAAVRDRSNTLIGYVGVAIDITERKQAEEDLRASREQLRQLAARDQSVRETERSRIALDIHDELGEQLTALKIDLFQLAKHLSGKASTRELVPNMRSTIGMVDSAIESVRRIAAELRPSVLDDIGLVAAIEWQLHKFQSRTRIRCAVHQTDEELLLEPERSTEVFRIFQEVLTNVARHANATAVNVGIKREGGYLLLEVRDNGRGITKQQITAPGSLGLLGMRERALRLRGELSVRGGRGKGTWVSLRVPVAGGEVNCAEDIDNG
jgi:PAS domain S-box-containing protein